MQKVSKKYKESMKSPLRERSFIKIYFGIYNQEAQNKATIDSGDFAYYSKSDTVFSERTNNKVYATLEENFTRVDGTMFFLPRENSSETFYDTGIISEDLISESNYYTLTINLNIQSTSFRGITVDFGENYPVDFDITNGNDKTLEIRENSESVFVTEEVFENTTSINLLVYKMKNLQSRLRIYSIRFGYGLVYDNDSVMSSSLESYISPIGADIPQIDFSVQLKNYDHYFDVDNPQSAIHFIETGQPMQIKYGYQLPDTEEIEWINGGNLLCSDWETDDYTATIRCQDVFRNMDTEFYKGLYSSTGKSYFDLAEEIIADAGLTDYYIDPRLKKLYTKNPIPRVQHKEALQIIANACRCVLSQTRNGTVQIKSSFIPDEISISSNGETSYSKISNILNDSLKNEYASLSQDYTSVDNKMYFLPKNGQNLLNTGYVSDKQSDENCKFDINPTITIVQETACMYYGIKFVFGNSLPAGIVIRTYNNDKLISQYEVEEEITKTLVIFRDFEEFDTMKIEFTKTEKPFNRIVLNYFTFGDTTDFIMEREDMTSSPKAIKQELVKDVVVPCYSYQLGDTEESIVSEEVTVNSGDVQTFFIDDPSYNFRATLNESSSNISIVSWGNYYITVKFESTGTFDLKIFGYRYKVIEQYATKSLNSNGTTIKWDNPLISNMEMANDLADWLGEYYSSEVEYEYTTRGNPEIDVNDIIYQENNYIENMKVNIYKSTLTFNQTFSGDVTARRIGG